MNNINISTYQGPSTGFKTMVVVSNKEIVGSKHYKEVHLFRSQGSLMYIITDGYEYLGIPKPIRDNLKSAINIVTSEIVPTPWYC